MRARTSPVGIAAWLLALSALAAPSSVLAQEPPSLVHNRLFTTPAERARLDELRRRPEKPTRAPSKPAPVAVRAKKPAPVLPRVSVQGVVLRSRGPATAWVNGESTLAGERLKGGIRVEAAGAGEARIVLPNRESVALRPGETYDPASGRTRAIEVRKRR